MPLARISVPAHLSQELITVLADAVQQGLVETCGVPLDDQFQLISRFQPDAMILNPTFPDMNRSADACIVEITFLRGRSDAQKRRLYARVVATAADAGFAPDDIMISLTENSPIDWSLGRGEAYDKRQDDNGTR
jgi:phenylpyruvate tautomerase PptA (4-oxalocrotonate tautomerase family)